MNNIIGIRIGDLLTRPKFFGLFNHYGVALGPDAVVQNAPGKGERLVTLREFAAGETISVQPTGANPVAVMVRAHETLANPKPYHPLWRNCQHTVFQIISGVAKSPALMIIGVLLLLGLLYFLLRRL